MNTPLQTPQHKAKFEVAWKAFLKVSDRWVDEGPAGTYTYNQYHHDLHATLDPLGWTFDELITETDRQYEDTRSPSNEEILHRFQKLLFFLTDDPEGWSSDLHGAASRCLVLSCMEVLGGCSPPEDLIAFKRDLLLARNEVDHLLNLVFRVLEGNEPYPSRTHPHDPSLVHAPPQEALLK